ncbi:putative deacetylase LmbE-like domain-containing protein [Lipomyces oligophaga]|uniref:putative deacetylase LmbE-like domain-containing protein n=1 Tax=Lipomyces oligophaga TaxID=45792 RepID=UPI0034CEB22A
MRRARSSKMRLHTVVLLLILFFAIWLMTKRVFKPTNARVLSAHFAHKKIALVIGHPDDEVMFFGPTLSAIRTIAESTNGPAAESSEGSSLPHTNLRILCLSTGNAENLGETRVAELRASAAKFGIPPTNVVVFDDPRVQDAMGVEWPTDAISTLVNPYLTDVDVVVTFDENGVSGHANHRSLNSYAKEYLVHNSNADERREVWTLNTCSILRKYITFLDIPITYFYNQFFTDNTRSLVITNDVHEYATTREAMTDAHKSQMVWFRWGWISLSRYMVVNDLTLISLSE